MLAFDGTSCLQVAVTIGFDYLVEPILRPEYNNSTVSDDVQLELKKKTLLLFHHATRPEESPMEICRRFNNHLLLKILDEYQRDAQSLGDMVGISLDDLDNLDDEEVSDSADAMECVSDQQEMDTQMGMLFISQH